MPLLPKKEKLYTVEDIYSLPEGVRAELVEGHIYYMAPPSRRHQKILLSLSRKIADYIDSQKGDCEVDIAPFAIFLNADDKNYVEPDISVICSKDKLTEKGCIEGPRTGSLKSFLRAAEGWITTQSFLNTVQQEFVSIGWWIRTRTEY